MSATVFLIDSELGVLRELLEADRRRLLLEIARTDHRSMRVALRTRESLLQSILQKLEIDQKLGLEPPSPEPSYRVAVTD